MTHCKLPDSFEIKPRLLRPEGIGNYVEREKRAVLDKNDALQIAGQFEIKPRLLRPEGVVTYVEWEKRAVLDKNDGNYFWLSLSAARFCACIRLRLGVSRITLRSLIDFGVTSISSSSVINSIASSSES